MEILIYWFAGPAGINITQKNQKPNSNFYIQNFPSQLIIINPPDKLIHYFRWILCKL